MVGPTCSVSHSVLCAEQVLCAAAYGVTSNLDDNILGCCIPANHEFCFILILVLGRQVSRVAAYGAFIDLDDNVSGLLHVNEMVAADGTEVSPTQQYQPGTEVTVRNPPRPSLLRSDAAVRVASVDKRDWAWGGAGELHLAVRLPSFPPLRVMRPEVLQLCMEDGRPAQRIQRKESCERPFCLKLRMLRAQPANNVGCAECLVMMRCM